jgi:hypothetical protein
MAVLTEASVVSQTPLMKMRLQNNYAMTAFSHILYIDYSLTLLSFNLKCSEIPVGK